MVRQLWQQYRSRDDWRMEISLGIHVVYAVYKGTLAIVYQSAWFAATAVYYLALGGIRFFLLRGKAGETASWQKYQTCGWLLLALTLSMGGVNFYTIRDARAVIYPWHLIYGAAAYTFYSLTATLVVLCRRRKSDPISNADGCLSLAASLMALFSMQTALLAAFANSNFPQKQWNAATGFVVVFVVILMAIQMIRRGIKKLQT